MYAFGIGLSCPEQRDAAVLTRNTQISGIVKHRTAGDVVDSFPRSESYAAVSGEIAVVKNLSR